MQLLIRISYVPRPFGEDVQPCRGRSWDGFMSRQSGDGRPCCPAREQDIVIHKKERKSTVPYN